MQETKSQAGKLFAYACPGALQNPGENSKWTADFGPKGKPKHRLMLGKLGNLSILSRAKNASLNNVDDADKLNNLE